MSTPSADGKVAHGERARARIDRGRRRGAGRRPELPVAAALLVRFERDDGLDQIEPDELEFAAARAAATPPATRDVFAVTRYGALPHGALARRTSSGDDLGRESDPQPMPPPTVTSRPVTALMRARTGATNWLRSSVEIATPMPSSTSSETPPAMRNGPTRNAHATIVPSRRGVPRTVRP